jgi:hypothetical protein
MDDTKITETRTAIISKDEHGIIIITVKDCGKVDEYDVVDLNLALRHITQGKPALKLMDLRSNWTMDKKAKERAKLENSSANTIARAVVVSNFLKAQLFRFLHDLGKKDVPQKFFTDKEEAHKWLLNFKNT